MFAALLPMHDLDVFFGQGLVIALLPGKGKHLLQPGSLPLGFLFVKFISGHVDHQHGAVAFFSRFFPLVHILSSCDFGWEVPNMRFFHQNFP